MERTERDRPGWKLDVGVRPTRAGTSSDNIIKLMSRVYAARSSLIRSGPMTESDHTISSGARSRHGSHTWPLVTAGTAISQSSDEIVGAWAMRIGSPQMRLQSDQTQIGKAEPTYSSYQLSFSTVFPLWAIRPLRLTRLRCDSVCDDYLLGPPRTVLQNSNTGSDIRQLAVARAISTTGRVWKNGRRI